MKEMNEQGFLSDKFDDWSGEPIPNGWGEIERNLRKDNKRRPLFWWLFPAALLVGGLSYFAFEKLNSLPPSNRTIVSTGKPAPSEEGTKRKDGNRQQDNVLKANQKIAHVSGDPLTRSNPTIEDKLNSNASKDSNPNPLADNERKSPKKHSDTRMRDALAGSVVIASTNDTKSSFGKSTGELSVAGNDGSALIIPKPSAKRKKNRIHRFIAGSELAVMGSGKVDNKSQSKLSPDGYAEAQVQAKSRKAVSQTEFNQQENASDANNGANQNFNQATDVPFLDSKNPDMPIPQLPDINPVLLLCEVKEIPFLTLEKSETIRKFQFFSGLQTGIGQNTIELRQSIAEQKVQITNANSIQTYFMQLSGGMSLNLTSWLRAFSGLQLGIINQNLRYSTKSKLPEIFSMVARDSLKYDMTPQWTEKSETRSQQALYANAEIGLKPLLFPSRNSGPFASVSVWTRISEKHSSDVPGSSPFIPVSNSVSLGYRVGYQHEIRKNIHFEAYMSSFPSGIFAGTKGVSITPRLIGLGCFYSY